MVSLRIDSFLSRNGAVPKYKFLIASCVALGISGCNYSNRQFFSPGYSQFSTSKTTFQDTPIRLSFFADLNPDCSNRGYPVSQVLEQPKNGTLNISHINNFTNYVSLISPQVECNKKRSPGSEVKYVPFEGFVGSDSAVVETVFPNGNVSRNRYNVVVRPRP